MPRKSTGPRLYWHKQREVYYVREGKRFIGGGIADRGDAERALAAYIATKDRPAGPSTPDNLTVAEALSHYGRERAPMVRDPARIGDCIRALVPVLGDLPLSALTGEVCRRYGKVRDRAPGTVRKELGTLQAAINHCHAEGYITTAPRVRLPEKPAPRDRWLSRDEVAALIRACRRNPKARHLARMILVAVYSGTRRDAILGLGFMPSTVGGWADCDRGVLYRRAEGAAETKKRTPTVPIPPRLLAHLRRWQRLGGRFVIECDGQRVASVKTAWRTTLREAGIDHCRIHDLRHTAITWAMHAGMSRWDAAGFFGVSMETLERVYAHHDEEHLAAAAAVMGRKV